MGSESKHALVTGITDPAGSYLTELLLAKGYEVHGLIRRSSSFSTQRIGHVYQLAQAENRRLSLHFGDLYDHYSGLVTLPNEMQQHEACNLAAQSHVGVSFDEPECTGDITGLGSIRLLEAIRAAKIQTRFYQASSSEMFGASPSPQAELAPFYAESPYGVAKAYSYWITRNYREAYGLFAANEILFNHESPRRGGTLVTRKITRAAARIKAGFQSQMFLGNSSLARAHEWAPTTPLREGVAHCYQSFQCTHRHARHLTTRSCPPTKSKNGRVRLASTEPDRSGTAGIAGTFSSFFPHHIPTMESGIILTEDEQLYQEMTSLQSHGWTRELPVANQVHDKTGDARDDLLRFVLAGHNVRPLEMEGTLGLEQMAKVPGLIAGRRANAGYVKERFAEILEIRTQGEAGHSSWFGFSMVLEGALVGRRSEVVNALTVAVADTIQRLCRCQVRGQRP